MAARYIRVPSPYRYIVIVDLPSGEIRLSEHVEDSKIQEFLDVHCPGVDFDPSEEGPKDPLFECKFALVIFRQYSLAGIPNNFLSPR